MSNQVTDQHKNSSSCCANPAQKPTEKRQNSPASGQRCPTREHAVYEPATNAYRKDDAIYVEAELPGVSTEGLQIDLASNVLTIRGDTATTENAPGELKYAEWRPGQYQRSFRLGSQIDLDSVQAELKNGLLKLKLSLKEEQKPRKIAVNVTS